jgi:hypothetical protein
VPVLSTIDQDTHARMCLLQSMFGHMSQFRAFRFADGYIGCWRVGMAEILKVKVIDGQTQYYVHFIECKERLYRFSTIHESPFTLDFLIFLILVMWFIDNKRLDGWVTEERIDFTQLQMPVKKEDKRSGNVGPKKARSRTLSMQKGTPNRKRKADDADGGDDDKV